MEKDPPSVVTLPFPESPAIIAFGGDLKASLCLARGGAARVVGPFGDLQEAAVFDRYRTALADLAADLNREPVLAVCDAHPGYLSSNLARESGWPVLEVRHHHAHVASVMAEHGLKEPVLGVAMDGTGYGEDGAVWGCEFLLCRDESYTRFAHLDYTPLVGGDQASRDAGQAAACYLLRAGLSVPSEIFRHRRTLQAALRTGVGCAESSSMGRLFDAVAAIVGVCAYNEHEGQCAILLQQCAEAARHAGTPPVPMAFEVGRSGGRYRADPNSIIRAAAEWRGRQPGAFALGFHMAVAEMAATILALARRDEGVRVAAFTGGVFQNRLLRELCREGAERNGFAVFLNETVSPGDGGIALGQALLAARGTAPGHRAGGIP